MQADIWTVLQQHPLPVSLFGWGRSWAEGGEEQASEWVGLDPWNLIPSPHPAVQHGDA